MCQLCYWANLGVFLGLRRDGKKPVPKAGTESGPGRGCYWMLGTLLFSDFYGKNLVPGKWHSGVQTSSVTRKCPLPTKKFPSILLVKVSCWISHKHCCWKLIYLLHWQVRLKWQWVRVDTSIRQYPNFPGILKPYFKITFKLKLKSFKCTFTSVK